jgi:hypothetical protein
VVQYVDIDDSERAICASLASRLTDAQEPSIAAITADQEAHRCDAPAPASVGTRVCSTIWSSSDGRRAVRPEDVALGPVILGALLDGSETAAPRNPLADGVTALVTKSPLTIHETDAGVVRLSVTDSHDAVRVLYDDAGMQAFAVGRYRFRDGATSVDLSGPSNCGQGTGGLVQYNGGFVAREPTCATISVSIDGVELGRRAVALAGGRC